jgi:hypothetical protein
MTPTPTVSPTSTPTVTATVTATSTSTLTHTPPPTPAFSSAAVSCINTDGGDGACRVFQLAIVANGAGGFPSQSYALVKDLSNNSSVFVGPWGYSNAGTTFTANLSGESFGVTSTYSPVSASLSVALLDATKGVTYGVLLPAGSPLSLEAPPGYLYTSSVGCNTTLEDGNCSVFNFYVYPYTPACAATQISMIKLTDIATSSTTVFGPVTYTCGSYSLLVPAEAMGIAPGTPGLNQMFRVDLYDATGTILWDSKTIGPLNLEYPGNSIASSSLSCLTSDQVTGACRAFTLNIDANGPTGINSTSYALVTDNNNTNYAWVGPINYMGSTNSFSVTLQPEDFGITSAVFQVPANFTVKLYDETKGIILDTAVPAGSPLTLEGPSEYIYSNSFGCNTYAVDGNCEYFTFNTYLLNPASSPVTTRVELIDLSTPATIYLGPFVNNGPGNQYYTANLDGELLGLQPGQTALNHSFEEILTDPSGVTILDNQPAGPFSYEYSVNNLAGSTLSCLSADSGNGACQEFVLTIDANAPAGVTSVSTALITDTVNGQYDWVGPWTYTGTGTSYSVTLNGYDFDVYSNSTPVNAAFTVKLYDATESVLLDSDVPAGSPMSIEYPTEFIYSDSFSCQTYAQDGNCTYFTFNANLDNPGATPVTSLVALEDLTRGVSVFLGPFVNTGGGNQGFSSILNSAQFGLNPGQTAVGDAFEATLYNSSSTTILDTHTAGTFSYEYPTAYLSSSSVTPLFVDPNNQAARAFVLNLSPDGPPGILSTSYAYVTDTQNGYSAWVGPVTYTGTSDSYSATILSSDLGFTTSANEAVSSPLSIKFYDANQSVLLNTSVPAGSPLTLEAPTEFIYGASYNTFSCQTLAADGNCVYFTYNTDLDAPFSTTTPVTTLVKLENLTGGVTVTLGPFVASNGSNNEFSTVLNAANFGLIPGQSAVNQQFQEQLFDASGVTLLDQSPAQTFSYEYPVNYLASASVSVLAIDPANLAAQQFLLTIGTNGPSGVLSSNTAQVVDTKNGYTYFVGPWSYTGSGSYSVTLNGTDFGLTTNTAPVSTGFLVKLYDQNETHWEDTIVPTGSPLTLEAPSIFIYGPSYNTFSCTTADEDGNCSLFTYNTDLDAPFSATLPVTTQVKLENLTSGVTVTLGPFVNNTGANQQHSVTLNGASFGLTVSGQSAVNQQFQEQVFDATGVTLMDQSAAQTFSYEFPPNYLASTALAPLYYDPVSQAYQGFALTVNANGPTGVPSVSYAYVIDTNNNYNAWVGPITYTGSGDSYSVTLSSNDFNFTSVSGPVSSNFIVRLYDAAQTHWLDTSTPFGSPVTLEAPTGYIYSNSFSGTVLAEDGNSVTFLFNTLLNTPGTATQNFEYALADLSGPSTPTTLFFGPVANPQGNHSYPVTLTGASFGLAAGQVALNQVFEEFLFDSTGTTILGYLPVGTLSLENNNPTTSDTLVSSSLSPLLTGVAGAFQAFLLNLSTSGTAGVTSTNFLRVTDLTNNVDQVVGPLTYSGAGSFPITLLSSMFNITSTSPVSAAFAVTLVNAGSTTVFGSALPAGSPVSLVAPAEYIYRSGGYNYLSCQTVAEDGNCEEFNFNYYLISPNGAPATTYLKVVDQNASGGPITVGFGPVTDTGGAISSSYSLFAQQFGLTTPGQVAAGQSFLELLYADAAGVTLLDSFPLGTWNLEMPSPYLSSASMTPVQTDPVSGACQQFLLNLNAVGPSGVPKSGWAYVTDLANNQHDWVGPVSINGTGSYSTTLNGSYFGVTSASPVSTAFSVTFYAANQTTLLNTTPLTGSPVSLEAPAEYLYRNISYNGLSCQTSAEDGNCEQFNFNYYLVSPNGAPATTYLKLIDLTAPGGPATVSFGPITNTGGAYSNSYILFPRQFGLSAPGQIAVSQSFEELLYADAASVTLLDSWQAGSLNLENPSPYISSASLSCVVTDTATAACRSVALNLGLAAPTGITKTVWAYVYDNSNGRNLWEGPLTFTGPATNWPITIRGTDLGLNTANLPVSTAMAVTLYDQAKSHILDTAVPVGSPLNMEAPLEYFLNNGQLVSTNTGEDGYTQAFNFDPYVDAPGSATVTTMVKLIDLSNSITVTNLLVDNNGGGYNPALPMLPSQFGVTAIGQIALNQVFLAQLYDASGVTLLDTSSPGTINLETPSPLLTGSSVSPLVIDPGTNAWRQFLLTLFASAPAGVTKTSYALVTDTTNNATTWVGPWTYVGPGNSFPATISPTSFGLATAGLPVTADLAVTLYDNAKTRPEGASVPTGSPMTLEAPLEYIASTGYSCQTTAEDGNCESFYVSAYLTAPGTNTVMSLLKVVDLSNGTTVNLGPVTDAGGGGYSSTYYLSPEQFGVTTAGQTALNQNFALQLFDSTGVTLLDQKYPGTINLENPSPFLSSSSLNCLTTDGGTGACQIFQLLLNSQGPAGVSETSYAQIVNQTTGTVTEVGPWTYSGSGSLAVTISGRSMGLTAAGVPVASQLAVTLLNGLQNKVLGVSFPTGGSPGNLEAAPAYIDSTSYNNALVAEDGNINAFVYYVYPYTPGCAVSQVSLIRLWDVSNGNSVTFGPVTYTCNSYSWYVTAAQLGLGPGQILANQKLVTQLLDSTGTKLWDTQNAGTISLEYPQDYLSSSSISCLTSDGGNGACQALQLNIVANSPSGVTEISYAQVADTTNGRVFTVGPWSYAGNGTSYSVTLSGYEFGFNNPTTIGSAQFAVTLFNQAQNKVFSFGTASGGPISLEAPPAYIDSASLTSPATLLAEDGNAKAFNFTVYPYTPSCSSQQTSKIRVVDTTSGNYVWVGPYTYTCNSFQTQVTATQLGLNPGQIATNHTFVAELWNSAQTAVWDTWQLGTFTYEGQ